MSRLFGPFVAIIVAAGALLGVSPSALALTADTKAPTIAVSTPAPSSTEAGQMAVTGSAWDNSKVAKVKVAIDSGMFQLASGTNSWSSSINTTSWADGTHIVKVKAWDNHGNARTKSLTVSFANSGSGGGSAGPQSMTTPEGTHITIDSSGPWTTDQIYQMLLQNGLNSKIGPTLDVVIRDDVASQVTAGASTVNGQKVFHATLYLTGANSSFSVAPDALLSHEYGHVWSYYHYYMDHSEDWTSYLQARGIAGDSRLNSSYAWSVNEIIADDYRLLFGSDKAISEQPQHLNRDIPDPRNVAGLRDFLASWGA